MWLYLLHVVIGVSPFGFCNFGLETEDLYNVTSAMSQTVAFYNTVTKPTLYHFIYFTAIFSVKIQILLLILIGKFCTDDMIDLTDTIANCCAQKSELHCNIRRLHIHMFWVFLTYVCLIQFQGGLKWNTSSAKNYNWKRKQRLVVSLRNDSTSCLSFGGGAFFKLLT